jgi:hypothetical protein
MKLNDRPTADLIVLALTLLICVVVFGVMISSVILELNGKDTGDGVTWVARIINTMVGGLFGYLAGRGVTTKINGNGNDKPMD